MSSKGWLIEVDLPISWSGEKDMEKGHLKENLPRRLKMSGSAARAKKKQKEAHVYLFHHKRGTSGKYPLQQDHEEENLKDNGHPQKGCRYIGAVNSQFLVVPCMRVYKFILGKLFAAMLDVRGSLVHLKLKCYNLQEELVTINADLEEAKEIIKCST